MGTRIVAWVVLAVVAGGVAAGRAVSQDEGAKPKEPAKEAPKKEAFVGADPRDHSAADMNRRMIEAMTPNRFHKELERFLGDWDVESTMTMMDQKSVYRGKVTYAWLYEGKWIQGDSVSNMFGMTVKGRHVMGYDNFKKKYVGSWVDSMGTAMYTFEGNYGKDRSTMFLYGQMDEYMTGEHDKAVAYVYRFDGPDRFTFSIHDFAIGIEGSAVIEAVYTRKK